MLTAARAFASGTTPRLGGKVLRAVLVGALVGVTVALWTYICLSAYEAAVSPGHDAHHGAHHGGPSGALAIGGALAMWMAMMIAMMVPAVLPWALAIARHGRAATAGLFLSGYFAVWLLFAAVATVSQWLLSATGVLSPALIIDNGTVRGVAFMILGAYQWSPLKDACLKHCESPVTFFLSRWRDGVRGALVMGAQHGLHCVGCCGLLMAFMAGVGAMSVAWMAGFTLYTLTEMYVPHLRWVSRAAGALLIVAGLASL